MQQVWRKRWRNTAWIALAAITLVLLVASVRKKNNKVCKGIEVTFNEDGNNFFIEEKGVVGLMKANGLVIGHPVRNIDLQAFEELLEKDKWIVNAELFFDNKHILQVLVQEETPVARIFTRTGSSFYIDSACRKLPLSEKLSARIPMFTNFPSEKAHLSRPDSELLASAKELAIFIQADEFWRAQVAQIDITPDGFEIIPTVGSHVVAIGKDGDWQQKFDRLFSFYKQVWTKVGFEKYEKLDVQFDGQVVATLKGPKAPKVDSQKVRVVVEKLIADANKSAGASMHLNSLRHNIVDRAKDNVGIVSKQKSTNQPPAKRRHLNSDVPGRALKTRHVKQVVSNEQFFDTRVPKAVMKKREPNKGG